MIGSLEELRRYLHTTAGGAQADDALLGDLLAAADDRFKSLVPGRTLEPIPAAPAEGDPPPDPVAKEFRSRGSVIRVPDLRTLTTITVDGVTTDPDTIDLEGRDGEDTYLIARLPTPAIGAIDVLVPVGNTWVPGTTARRRVIISGFWGPAEVMPRVKEAILIWAARVYHERAARWSDARQDPDGGVASYFRSVPPSIKATADSLRGAGT
jgi:hypothetical protein